MDVAVEGMQYPCRQIRNNNLNCHVVDELRAVLARKITVKINTTKGYIITALITLLNNLARNAHQKGNSEVVNQG